MPNIKQGVQVALGIAKDTVNVVADVAGGVADYSESHKEINTQASKEVSKTPSGSYRHDAHRVGQRIRQIKKEKGVTLVGSVKNRLKNPDDNILK